MNSAQNARDSSSNQDIPHNMKPGSPILTGEYLRSAARNQLPKELVEAMGIPVPPALESAQNERA